MKRVYLGLGANIGQREGALQQAITALHKDDLRITRVSAVYETAPRDVLDQPAFLNLVAEADTALPPMRLLLRVLNIERRLGRKRLTVRGPRTIDIDILFYGGVVMEAGALTIPHPRMHERRFVLEPLAELTPEAVHPVLGRTVRELLEEVRDQQARAVAWTPTIPGAG